MWVKKADSSYLNLTTNATLHVYPSGGGYAISANNTGAPVASGFVTAAAAAQEALDTFMTEQGFETIPNGGN